MVWDNYSARTERCTAAAAFGRTEGPRNEALRRTWTMLTTGGRPKDPNCREQFGIWNWNLTALLCRVLVDGDVMDFYSPIG